MSKTEFDVLKLENQLCFPLYACSREVIKRYKPFLDPLDLTYTQYVTMMVLWEEKSTTVKALGKRLYLDSGTLTPLLKKLENKGYLTRKRSAQDERNLIITITPEGEALRAQAEHIPVEMAKLVNLQCEEIKAVYNGMYKLLEQVQE